MSTDLKDYCIKYNKYHGFTVRTKESCQTWNPKYLVYHGPTNGNPERFKVKGFILHTELIANCSNLTCYFKTHEQILKALKLLKDN